MPTNHQVLVRGSNRDPKGSKLQHWKLLNALTKRGDFHPKKHANGPTGGRIAACICLCIFRIDASSPEADSLVELEVGSAERTSELTVFGHWVGLSSGRNPGRQLILYIPIGSAS